MGLLQLDTSTCLLPFISREEVPIGNKQAGIHLAALTRMSQAPRPQLLPSTAEEALCGTHLQPLQLFCDDDQITVCSKCAQCLEHKRHAVYGLQEAAEYYRVRES